MIRFDLHQSYVILFINLDESEISGSDFHLFTTDTKIIAYALILGNQVD
jgi:hypothetical protein